MSNAQLQRIFDHAVPRLLDQGVPSRYYGAGSCLYRFNGLKCVIGHCISDKAFSKHLSLDGQDYRASSDKVRWALSESGFENDAIESDDLTSLQQIHDLQPPEQWSKSFVNYAKERGLRYE